MVGLTHCLCVVSAFHQVPRNHVKREEYPKEQVCKHNVCVCVCVCLVPGWPERRRCFHLWGAEHPLSFHPRSVLPPFFHSQSLHVALSRGFWGPSGARSEVTVAPCCFWGMWLVAEMMGGRGVCRVRGMRRMLWRVVTGWGAELRVAGTTHYRRGWDDSQDPPTWVGSLSGDWGKTEESYSVFWRLWMWRREFLLFIYVSESVWYLLALYAGDSGVSPTGDKGQRYSWIWSMLIAQFRIASLWWWIVDGLQTQHFSDVKNLWVWI